MLYLFDLDGTLCNIDHRLHYIKPAIPKQDDWHDQHTVKTAPNWTAFYQSCVLDTPIPEIVYVAKALWEKGAHLVIVTGRSDEVQAQTMGWLAAQGIIYSCIYMRKAGDYRPDTIVKSEILDLIDKEYVGLAKISGVFDDRASVTKMYRARGLRVFQVADGEF